MALGNSIFRIVAHKRDGLWLFDNEKFGIQEQPFVFGSDLVLDKMTEEVDEAEQGVNILFSGIPFPGSEHCLELVREETEGFVYRWRDHNLQGWISPVIKNYFPVPPPQIYLQVKPVEI